MRIVVSGTHASGKSTLISDFALSHPEYTVLPDPFELIDEAWDAPSLAMFEAQLRVAADRLHSEEGERIIAERGPIDFLAYILATADLTGVAVPADRIDRAVATTADALRTVDLLVILPLSTTDRIHVGAEEHLQLRDAMDRILLELLDDPDVVDEHLTVAEITGDPATRLTTLEALAAGTR